MTLCCINECNAADCLHVWPTGWLNDKLTVWLTDWLTVHLDSLVTDRLFDWYADITDWLTSHWHGADWQMSPELVGGREWEVWRGCWCVERCLYRWRWQERRKRGELEKETAPCFPVKHKVLLNLRVFLSHRHPGQADRDNNLWLSAWHCEL